ncbi:hypothetical protein [Streptomyces graminilatus]|uniref:hypothetical protein n=1 Tax=Streptomyces graminilatus TaxID=1464070 RepID=UPI000A3FBDA9|nr:hypothetical protein [Streptomyces graminilatus]
MSGRGGSRHWNEETQRWEEAGSPDPAPVTPPPPPRPSSLPTEAGLPRLSGTDPLAYGPVYGPPAYAGEWPPVPAPTEAPTVPPPDGWPGAAGTDVSAPWPPAAGPVDAGDWPPAPEAPTVSAPVGWPGAATVDGDGHFTDGHFDESHFAEGPITGGPAVSWPPPTVIGSGRGIGGGGQRRRFLWSVLIGAAVVAVAGSLVLTFVGRPGGDGKDAPTTGAHNPTRSATSLVSPVPPTSPTSVTPEPTGVTASPSEPVVEPPTDYALYKDQEGFRIALPKGWTRTSSPSLYGIRVVDYRSADRTHRVQVYQVSESSPAKSFELYLSDEIPKAPGFTKLRLQTLDDGTFTGSRLEYLADSLRDEPDPGVWHVYDERFVAQDGKIYAIAAYGPDSDGRDDELELLNTALTWFCPPLGSCEAPVPQDSTVGTP